MIETTRVIDEFLTPQEYHIVRQSALTAGFGTWQPATDSVLGVNAFAGVGYMGDHATIFRALVAALGRPVFPGETKFRTTARDAAPAYIHSDRSSGTHSAILYLSDDDNPESGTAFYHYRPNPEFPQLARGLKVMPCYDDMAGTHWGDRLKLDMRDENPEDTDKWELVSFIRALPNRMLIFPSALFHSRLPRAGLGDTDATARMIWVCHLQL